ncbi:MAG: sugar ABC transporter ATP-binding protein [Halanaerobiales bacterium]
MEEKNILEVNSLNKSFPGVQALSEVNFNLKKGETHVIIGENGAGKSTFLNILSGDLKPNSGQIKYDGEKYEANNTAEARAQGISMAYQELKLVPSLTVAENILMGDYEYRGKVKAPELVIDWKKTYKKAEKLLKKYNLNIDPGEKLNNLGVGERQLVEIVRAVSKDIKVLLLDEPTSALSKEEVNILFDNIIANMKKEKVSIIYISHRLEEAFQIGDRVTVLRDGKKIKTMDIQDTDEDELIQLMVGRQIDDRYVKIKANIGQESLRVEGLSTENKINNCSFKVNRGEIVGFSGLMGAGRTELAKALMGIIPKTEGEIFIGGEKVKINHPETALEAGLGYLAENREESLIYSLNVAQNITLASLGKIFNKSRLKIIDKEEEIKTGKKYVEQLNIDTPDISRKVRFLSGGNQQKVALARWIYRNAEVFILDEPTRGIDVGAKIEVYHLIGQLVKQNKGVILISSELPEIVELCDRTYVMDEGEIAGELTGEDITQEKIMKKATGKEITYGA